MSTGFSIQSALLFRLSRDLSKVLCNFLLVGVAFAILCHLFLLRGELCSYLVIDDPGRLVGVVRSGEWLGLL